MKDLWLALLSCHQWWACYASTKEEAIEKIRDCFPGDRTIKLFNTKNIDIYNVYEE